MQSDFCLLNIALIVLRSRYICIMYRNTSVQRMLNNASKAGSKILLLLDYSIS